MKKRLLLIFIVTCLVMFSTFTAFASSTQLNPSSIYTASTVTIGGKAINTSGYNIYANKDGIPMYPIRLIAEGLGAEVSWDPSNNSAVVVTEKDKILLNPTTEIVTVNGVSKKLGYNVEIKNSRIYVPVTFISEILGVRFELKEDGNISIEKPFQSLETLDLSSEDQQTKDALAAYLTSLELHRNFSGQVLVENDGKVLIDRSYGYSDYENQIKTFNSTTLGIGSVTKQFTAAAIMQLAEQGKLSYEDKVSVHLENVPYGDQITIHQLLTHTSGLHNYTNLLINFINNADSLDLAELSIDHLMKLIKDAPLDFEPGTNFAYSNTGYLLLGKIVEVISGENLEEYLHHNIFEPAGMESTGIAYRLDEKLVEANGYVGHDELILDTTGDRILVNMAYGAGYLASTVQDLYRWNVALLDGRIISKESLDIMFGRNPNMDLLAPYAYGWFFEKGRHGEEISHGGNLMGYTSLNSIYTQENLQVIILTNRGHVDLLRYRNDIVSTLKGDIVAPVEAVGNVELSEEQLNKYAGSYEIAGLGKISVMVVEGKLSLKIEGQPLIQLSPVSQTKFESTVFGIKVEFDNMDTPQQMALDQAGYKFTAVRVESEEREIIEVSEEQLNKYVGNYEIKGMLKIDILVKDGKLMLQGENQPAIELTPVSQTRFESLVVGLSIEFDNTDTPEGFILEQLGQKFNAERLK